LGCSGSTPNRHVHQDCIHLHSGIFSAAIRENYETKDLVHVGIMWLALTLVFEWGGSFIIRRPVSEIVVGWNIFAGYMWPYVLLAYLSSNFIVGMLLNPGKKN